MKIFTTYFNPTDSHHQNRGIGNAFIPPMFSFSASIFFVIIFDIHMRTNKLNLATMLKLS